MGYGFFSATQLKIIQEAISVAAFVVFGYVYLKETPSWRTGLAFLLILAAVMLAASDRGGPKVPEVAPPGTEARRRIASVGQVSQPVLRTARLTATGVWPPGSRANHPAAAPRTPSTGPSRGCRNRSR